ncbi:MAG: 4-hydroxy-tetrahydrodipicolinate reductase [Candidatus Binatia bacterium]
MSRAPLIVLGAGGRMGRRILALAEAGQDTRVAGAVEIAGSGLVGRDAGELAGTPALGVTVMADFEAAATAAGRGAVAVDFTAPEAAVEHARQAASLGTPIVIGTTGFTKEQRDELRALAERTPLLLSANMSVGVNVLLGLVGEAVRLLGADFDIEIVEVHHNKKKDAPSGTALALAEAAAQAAGVDPATALRLAREGITGERSRGEIGVVALRGGDNVGEHTVMLLGTGERVELSHRASSRDCLAAGAVRAGAWLFGRPPGLYSMKDVLGLRS